MRIEIAPGRKALVTGGASGLGLDIARGLVAEGASVALLDIDPQRTAEAAAEIGGGTIATPADVRSEQQVNAAVERAIAELGGLDTLVVSAGVVHVGTLAQVSEQDWDRVLDVNLKGAFLSCKAAAPSLTASGRGRIVTIGSDAGRRAAPLMLAYSCSKFGLIGLTQSLAGELAPHVTVNSVCPIGVADTGMGQQMLEWKVGHTGQAPDAVLGHIAKGLPMARNGTAEDVTLTTLFLVSEGASFITGIAIDVRRRRRPERGAGRGRMSRPPTPRSSSRRLELRRGRLSSRAPGGRPAPARASPRAASRARSRDACSRGSGSPSGRASAATPARPAAARRRGARPPRAPPR